MQKDNRLRKFALVSYLQASVFEQKIARHIDDVIRFAYVVHDKDFDKEDVKEETHIQALLYTYNSHSFSAIRKWFAVPEGTNTLCQRVRDDIQAYEYLTHANETNPLKYHYKKEDIISYNFNLDEVEQDDNGFGPLRMLLNKEKKSLIAKRYGRDFIYHYKAYKELAEDILFEEQQQLEVINKVIEPIQEKFPF